LYFAPIVPPGLESNWIKTILDQEFFVMFRLYNPLAPVYDGTWKLVDLERVQ
jgi:hypothetical protein